MENGGKFTRNDLSMSIAGCVMSNEIIEEDSPRPISKAVWEDEHQQETFGSPFKTACGHRQQGSHSQAIPHRSKHLEEDDAQHIPDLEEEADVAPRTHRLPTIKELDTSMPYPIQCTTESGLDLRPLVSSLLPVHQIVEDDEPWELHKLLTEMSFILNENKEVGYYHI